MRNIIKTGALLPAVFILLSLVLLLPAGSAADLYLWTDSDGVLHITDDLGKVPQGRRSGVKTFKSTPLEAAPAARPAPPVYIEKERKGAELYGDHPVEWWLNTFRKTRSEIQSLEAGIESKRQFISVFEGGRRFGQIYGKEDIERYELFKVEAAEDSSRLDELKAGMAELKRKAAIYGVPEEAIKD
jgi:hypothetical protein